MIDLDELLRADASRWRGELPPVASLDALAATVPARSSRRRFLLPALAAAVVVALAIGLAIMARTRTDHGDPSAADLSEITGVVWTDTGSSGTVAFTNTTMRVFDGCSNELHELIVDANTITQGAAIGKVSTCSPPPMPSGPAGAEQRAEGRRLAHFYAVLRGPATWSVANATLTLTTPGAGTVELTNDGAAAPQIVGTSWVLLRYNDADLYGHDADRLYGLRIDVDGTFHAEQSCGTLTGHADVTPTSIDFGTASIESAAPTGNAGCGSDGASGVIARIVSGGRADYEIRGTQLILSEDGGRLLVYDGNDG